MIRKDIRTAFFLLSFLFLPCHIIPAQEPDYPSIFGNDWQKGISFLEENSGWIKAGSKKYNIAYEEIVAVVFPELVRYSALRDKMEVTLLKTLYRNLGEDYADFSVGVFQVKPSFAEKVLIDIRESRYRIGKLFLSAENFPNDYQFRSALIADLENPEREFTYIMAFMKICEKKFDLAPLSKESRIKFLATAYNTGFWKSGEEIKAMEEKKFYNTKLIKTESYPYADISLCWYKNYFLKKDK